MQKGFKRISYLKIAKNLFPCFRVSLFRANYQKKKYFLMEKVFLWFGFPGRQTVDQTKKLVL